MSGFSGKRLGPLTPEQEKLVYWISIREAIRVKKEAGIPPPWSDDPVFQTTYFCNVHREDDKVTRWIRKYLPYKPDGLNEWRMMVARMFNNPDTLHEMDLNLVNPNMKSSIVEQYILNVCKNRAIRGKKTWGNAYVVTTCGAPVSKAEYCSQALGAAFAKPPIVLPCHTLEHAHGLIMQHQGFASFMAAQVVADLKNMPGHPLCEASDWWTWSAPGPGSLRGLNWFFYGSKDGAENLKIVPSTYSASVWIAYRWIKDRIPKMCMQDFQNCLCEFDKYMRVSTGAGRSKRKYHGYS